MGFVDVETVCNTRTRFYPFRYVYAQMTNEPQDNVDPHNNLGMPSPYVTLSSQFNVYLRP